MSATPGKNPYRPGAATVPLHLAGRDVQIKRFRKLLAGAPELPANLRLTGLRGVGKSVLLRELESVANASGWVAARRQLEPRHNTEDELCALLAAVASAAGRRASRLGALKGAVTDAWVATRGLLNVTIEDVTFSLAGGGQAETTLAEALFDAVETAVRSGHEGFVLLLDEAQVLHDDTDRGGEHPLSMLVAAVNALQESGLPIALVLCGLPTLRAHLQKARTYSERMFRAETIGELEGNPGAARDAFVEPLRSTGITADEALIARVLEEVEGYPFFIQLWGAELWDAATSLGFDRFTEQMLDAIEGQIYERLDEEFYAGRVETLTPSEQDVLMLSGQCPYPPLRTSDIRARSDKSDGNINVLMGRLTEQGVIYRIQKGQYAYTAPKFAEYLRRRAQA
ncbi:ATP-binding protein [Cellulomonas sp. SLBN-39]|uniref:ATP-binding protein n=1 Tax=Cellulomonas sp. SLBN-39 TaxID=2768446 RepID=UPI00116E388C|nr:ATP-binding protein [Cellulomonas sp. SLBN-39]TQL02650.1 AAA ATPase-like protein [Cellulomonas sp. SLBN-39]